MEETTLYPPIEPSNFDLIVVGTGRREGRPPPSSQSLLRYSLRIAPPRRPCLVLAIAFRSQPQLQASDNQAAVPLATRPVYSELEISSEPLECSRKFSLDLVAPRVFLCADPMIDLILKTGINQYMEFKSVDASFVSGAGGKLENVPDSRSAIFKSRNLLLTEKNQLMKFFKLVQGHLVNGSGEEMISEQDLESIRGVLDQNGFVAETEVDYIVQYSVG